MAAIRPSVYCIFMYLQVFCIISSKINNRKLHYLNIVLYQLIGLQTETADYWEILLNQASSGHRQTCAWFLEVDLVHKVCVCVSVSACLPLWLVITSGVMWCDMNPYDWLNRFHSFCMAAIISIISRRGPTIKACCRNQPNKNKLVLYKPLLHFYSH